MEENKNEVLDQKKAAFQFGLAVFILLAALTIGEYAIGSIAVGWWSPILAIAVLKAFFVVRDYMHISRLFTAEEDIQA